jgi:hypothetical protein
MSNIVMFSFYAGRIEHVIQKNLHQPVELSPRTRAPELDERDRKEREPSRCMIVQWDSQSSVPG